MTRRYITKKLAVLLALVLAHRSSDLVRLSLKGRRYSQDGVTLSCVGLAKQSRPGKMTHEVFIASFEDPAVCPVACLRSYERVTRGNRKSDNVFLATVSPYKAVSSSSIARWIKDTIGDWAGRLWCTFFQGGSCNCSSNGRNLHQGDHEQSWMV